MSNFNTLPAITLLPADRERLERLAYASMDRIPQTAEYLAREIERARVLDAGESAEDFVRMESAVTFRDDSTGQERRITLVYPNRADIADGRVSVMTPIGAALIGLSKGQKIAWQTPAGDSRSLTVLAVNAPVAAEREPA